MHVSRCIIRDAELIAFEREWMPRSADAFGSEGKTENRMWRDMKATVVLREVSLVGVSVFTVTSIFN